MSFRCSAGRSRKRRRKILDEHARLRGRLVELAIDLDLHCLKPDVVSAFVDELRSHAAREELLLYPWAARQLGNVVGAHLRRALSVSKRKTRPPPRQKRRGGSIRTVRRSASPSDTSWFTKSGGVHSLGRDDLGRRGESHRLQYPSLGRSRKCEHR